MVVRTVVQVCARGLWVHPKRVGIVSEWGCGWQRREGCPPCRMEGTARRQVVGRQGACEEGGTVGAARLVRREGDRMWSRGRRGLEDGHEQKHPPATQLRRCSRGRVLGSWVDFFSSHASGNVTCWQ